MLDALTAQIETKGLAAKRQIRVRITSDAVDLTGDRILPDGVDTSGFETNPVVLFGHDHSAPIARVVSLERNSREIVALIQFPPPGTSQKSDEAYSLVLAGVISAASVGIIVDEATEDAA